MGDGQLGVDVADTFVIPFHPYNVMYKHKDWKRHDIANEPIH
jgi:hypothetical protein